MRSISRVGMWDASTIVGGARRQVPASHTLTAPRSFPPHEGEGGAPQAASTPFSISSGFSSPVWNISRTMSEPPTNSPFT